VQVKTHVVFGDAQTVAACLQTSPVSKAINTSFVERDNLIPIPGRFYISHVGRVSAAYPAETAAESAGYGLTP